MPCEDYWGLVVAMVTERSGWMPKMYEPDSTVFLLWAYGGQTPIRAQNEPPEGKLGCLPLGMTSSRPE